jgi:hypothetical protein
MVAMHHPKGGSLIIAGSVFLALMLVLVGEGFLLGEALHPGTHLLRSHSSLSAMLRAWH